jgi:quinoprotein glucose dehydrogenase
VIPAGSICAGALRPAESDACGHSLRRNSRKEKKMQPHTKTTRCGAFALAACPLVLAALAVAAGLARTPGGPPSAPAASEWPCYGRDAGGTRFAPLTQINRRNVAKLRVAWTYRTGDLIDPDNGPGGAFEATPICADGTLYLSTPYSRVVALDPETGKARWTFDPKIERRWPYATDPFVSRGVSIWQDPQPGPGAPGRRLFLGTYDGRLIALDAQTGKPCSDFGTDGQIDLKRDIGGVDYGEYQITSPPAIVNDLVIVGAAISDNRRVRAPSGCVRAFDARTGALRWRWDPIPRDASDPARKTWAGDSADHTGAANAWSILSVDAARGLVFVPTSSPSPDFYGGLRRGDNRYANSLVALRAETGKVVWHFQVVHHDLWDFDIPAQPNLVTVRRGGKDVPAVVVATKMGFLFVLRRETGEPLFPVEERPVPQEAAAGEQPSPTQPFPVLPPPLVPQRLSPDDAWGLTPADREAARKRLAALRCGPIFTPPSLQGTVLYPGNVGGVNWSGTSFDPRHGLLFVNTNRLGTIITLFPADQLFAERKEYGAKDASHLTASAEIGPQTGAPYGMRREWLLAEHLPMTPPPWGTLAAVDLATGALRWQVPLGTIPALSHVPGSQQWGSINLGGSMVTAGGLVFIAAGQDSCLRAFDAETGKELWKESLPAGGQATPMTYQAKNGRQYVVICAGGHRGLGTPLGDYVVAYALPAK